MPLPRRKLDLPRARKKPTENLKERSRFYVSGRWKRLRDKQLKDFPLCEKCQAEGRTSPATTVHHILERLLYPELALDQENLQSLCQSHHSIIHNARRKAEGYR